MTIKTLRRSRGYCAYQWIAILAAIVICCLCCHALFAAEDCFPEIEIMKLHVMSCAKRFGRPVKSTIKRIVLCRDSKDLAARTFCPEEKWVVARANLHHSAIFLTRPSRSDFYHEAAHVIYQSVDELLADRFMRFCLDEKEGAGQ